MSNQKYFVPFCLFFSFSLYFSWWIFKSIQWSCFITVIKYYFCLFYLLNTCCRCVCLFCFVLRFVCRNFYAVSKEKQRKERVPRWKYNREMNVTTFSFYFHETLHNWILMDFGPAGGPPFRFTMAHASTIILYRAKRLFVCSFFFMF